MIRDARIKQGMTQVELAYRLKVSQGAVGCWELGISFPRPKTLVEMCMVLKIPVQELIKAG